MEGVNWHECKEVMGDDDSFRGHGWIEIENGRALLR